MNQKVKFKATFDDMECQYTYVIKSKSLSAALARAMLVIEVAGDDVQIEHLPPLAGRKKHKIFVTPL